MSLLAMSFGPRALLCHAVLYRAVLCYTLLCHAMLCYAVLCCAVLCCAMLCDVKVMQSCCLGSALLFENCNADTASNFE